MSSLWDQIRGMKMTERNIIAKVPFEGSMRNAISRATKILYKQECEDEYCS